MPAHTDKNNELEIIYRHTITPPHTSQDLAAETGSFMKLTTHQPAVWLI